MIPRPDRQFIDCSVQFAREDGVIGEGHVFNLSVDGCAVRSQTTVAEGMYLSLTLELPGKGPVVIQLARTRWATSEEFGVKFLILYKKDRHALLAWLRIAASQQNAEI